MGLLLSRGGVPAFVEALWRCWDIVGWSSIPFEDLYFIRVEGIMSVEVCSPLYAIAVGVEQHWR